MPAYRVLIVDDQRDVRRVLRDGIWTLDQDIDIIDVPSGEEAILVISRQPVDLLVTDVSLPGISGLELLERARVRNPGMRCMLITGLTDQKVRDDVAGADVQAYFFKPVEMSDFLEAVQHCLDPEALYLLDDEEVEEMEDEEEAAIPRPTLSEHLSGLRKELQAVCVVLMDERGQIMAQAGNLPDIARDGTFVSSLMATFSAAAKVSYVLEIELPRDLLYFAAQGQSFILTHVGQSLGLLLVVKGSRWDDERVWSSLHAVPATVQELFVTLTSMGVFSAQEGEPVEAAAADAEEELSGEAALPELDAIFKQAQQKKVKPEDVDAFWDSATLDTPGEMTRADVITYDQARQLGLAPEDE